MVPDDVKLRIGNLAGLTANEMAERLEALRPRVEQSLSYLTTATNAAISCASDVITKRSVIANQAVGSAVTNATSHISSTAPSVFNNLQNLLTPSNTLLNSVQQVISAGKNLLEAVGESTANGQAAFENLVSNSYNGMQEAITCVNTHSGTIEGYLDDLMGFYTEIENTPFVPMQSIPRR